MKYLKLSEQHFDNLHQMKQHFKDKVREERNRKEAEKNDREKRTNEFIKRNFISIDFVEDVFFSDRIFENGIHYKHIVLSPEGNKKIEVCNNDEINTSILEYFHDFSNKFEEKFTEVPFKLKTSIIIRYKAETELSRQDVTTMVRRLKIDNVMKVSLSHMENKIDSSGMDILVPSHEGTSCCCLYVDIEYNPLIWKYIK